MMQHLKDTIARKIEKLEKMESFLNLLPDLSHIENIETRCDEDAVYINLPFDWSVYREIRKKFRGWDSRDSWTTTQHDDGDVSQHKVIHPHDSRRLYFDSPYVIIALHTQMAYSVCEVEQVGIIEIPHYKVVCK